MKLRFVETADDLARINKTACSNGRGGGKLPPNHRGGVELLRSRPGVAENLDIVAHLHARIYYSSFHFSSSIVLLPNDNLNLNEPSFDPRPQSRDKWTMLSPSPALATKSPF